VPEDTEATLILFDLLNSLKDIVHAEVLVVLGQDLVKTACRLPVEDEVLHQIQESRRVAGSPDDRFQGDNALFTLLVDLLPFGEVFPFGSYAADSAS